MKFEEFIVFRNVEIANINHEKIIKLFYPYLSSVSGDSHILPNLIGNLLKIDLSISIATTGCFNKSVIENNADFYIKFDNGIEVFIYGGEATIELKDNQYAICVFADNLDGIKERQGNVLAIKMSAVHAKQIEYYIQENLCGKDGETALKFVSFLRANNCEFIKDNGYWKDKIYYIIKSHDKCICFISIKDPDEKDNRWTVWSDDIESDILDSSVVDDKLKEIAWNHVDHCGNCGSFGGGRHKIIFGKKYGDVCGCTFRFDNPTATDLGFMCRMVEIQIK